MFRRLRDILLWGNASVSDGINHRRWFVFYVLYLAALTAVVLGALRVGDDPRHPLLAQLWLPAIYVFYLSLCNTFFPAPTTWLVLLVASPIMGLVTPEGLIERYAFSPGAARWLSALGTISLAATLGALGTTVANLTEYHVFTFLLGLGKVGKVRETRIYRTASRWFAVSPFGLMVVASFLPIPVDVIRWLAITYRYPRGRYALASFLGRLVRYGLLAATATCLALGWRSILAIQLALAGLIGARYLPRLLKRRKAAPAESGATDVKTVMIT
jgi:membrane protein YqaA with SNARE-associated domain